MSNDGAAPIPESRSLDPFIEQTLEPTPGGDEAFEVVKDRLLRIDVRGDVMIRRGTAIAYRGDLRFVRERVLQWEKAGQFFGRESVPIVHVAGTGVVVCADEDQQVTILRGTGQAVYVTGRHLLAFESSLEHDVRIAGLAGILAGGIYAVELRGHGLCALAVRGAPMTLPVTPDAPIFTAPANTVAWTEGLTPELKTHFETRSLLGLGSGQEIQMRFAGTGYVVVQAKADVIKGDPVRTVKTVLKKLIP